jgi:glycosyltransferase involved in cell wall biosynthesis
LKNKGFDFEFYKDISDSDLVRLYENSTLLMFLSTYEGFGMPIVEAQNFGLPVIASNLNVFKNEVCLNSCLYVDINKNIMLNSYIEVIMSNYAHYVGLSYSNAARFTQESYFHKINQIIES